MAFDFPEWAAGSERTNLRDAHLSLAEWQTHEEWLYQLALFLGVDLLSVAGGSTLADMLTAITTTAALAVQDATRNLRIVPVDGEETHQVHITADRLGVGSAILDAVDVTLDLEITGLLGLDNGIEAADTHYAVWVGRDPAANLYTAIFSEAFTVGGLTLAGALATYTEWRRVGSRRNNASGDLWAARQYDRRVLYDEAASTGLEVLGAGTATTKTDVDCSDLVPPTAVTATIHAQQSGSSAVEGYLFHGDSHLTGAPGTYRIQGVSFESIVCELSLGDSSTFAYLVTSGESLTAYLTGYEDGI